MDLITNNEQTFPDRDGAYIKSRWPRGTSFTLIEILVVMLIFSILMAIIIPMIKGSIGVANNTKCRSNLAQLHTAIISHAKSNDDFILENLAFNNDLTVLIDNGYLDVDAKLGDCPGQEGKQKPSDSSYVGGEKMDGSNSLLALTDADIILYDKGDTHHKMGRNAILEDGSFRQPYIPSLSPQEKQALNQQLYTAVWAKNTEKIRNLLEKGADVNTQDDGRDRTPMHISIVQRHKEGVEALLSAGEINLELPDVDGHKPLHVAVVNKNKEITTLLLEGAAKVNAEDRDWGLRPLHYAVMNSNPDSGLIQLLLDHGANPYLRNGVNRTPRQLAIQQGRAQAIIDLLQEAETQWNNY